MAMTHGMFPCLSECDHSCYESEKTLMLLDFLTIMTMVIEKGVFVFIRMIMDYGHEKDIDGKNTCDVLSESMDLE